MATEGFKRKLAAVFSADVAGYSRLMGEDEAATLTTLETYKQVMFVLIRQHRGRVVASPGDNVLAEFASVVDAVQCGVAVQKEIQARNAELPESRRMQFRIGINLGDVIEEGDSIYGDGVNIAARLESLADPGGICISKTAFEQIEAKLPLGYEFLGEQTVKNIAKPVGTYRVLMEPRVTVKAEAEVKPKVSARRRPFVCCPPWRPGRGGGSRSVLVFHPSACPTAGGESLHGEDGLSPARQAVHRRHALREHDRGSKAGFLLRWVDRKPDISPLQGAGTFRHLSGFHLLLQGKGSEA